MPSPPRRIVALLLAALCLAPAATASRDPNPLQHTGPVPEPDDQDLVRYFAPALDHFHPSPVVPCLLLNLSVDRPAAAGGDSLRVDQAPLERSCNLPRVHLQWNATAFGGRGVVAFTFDTDDLQDEPDLTLHSADARPRPLSPLSAILMDARVLLPAARTQASLVDALPVRPPRTVVSASFDVAWGGDCADAHGTFGARVNDAATPAQAPQDLFRDLCLLSSGSAADLLAGAGGAAVAIGGALQPLVPAPVVQGLALLLATLRAPEPPSAQPEPQPHVDEARAAGEAALVALDPDALLAERHAATYETPLAEGAIEGGATLVEPSVAWLLLDAADAWGGERGPVPQPAPARGPAPPVTPPTVHDAVPSPDAPPTRAGAAPTTLSVASVPPGPDRAALAAALAGLAAAGALAILAALALYQRATTPAALRHEGRARLLRACQGAPRGATAGELAAAVGMERKTAEYHLRYLVRLGVLRADRAPDGPWRFASLTAPRPAPAAPPLEQSVLARICARPGASAAELARELGVARRRVDRRVKDLLVDGLVESRVEGRERRLYPA